MLSETISRTKDEAWIQRPPQRKRKRWQRIRRKTLLQEKERQITGKQKDNGMMVNGRSQSSWDDWFWDYSEDSHAAKCKGKKGKMGKGKGKYGKDGTSGFKGGAAQLADAAQSRTTTAAATTFFVDHSNHFNFSFMATENHVFFITQPLTPTSMVLDLGCTRAMTSRVAVQDLMNFCEKNTDYGIWYTTDETTSQFTFAIS